MKLRKLVSGALPDYDIGVELGRGGCGVVFGGTHRRLGRRVAIKVLTPGVAANPDIRTRFLIEGEVLAALDHPGIVSIYDYVERDGLCLLVMEHISGRDLWSRFRESGLTWRGSCVAMSAICTALQHAHDRGVLHRDMKPSNVLVTDDGVVKVIDFGIAKMIGGTRSYATTTGQLLGTPAYMAPEQIDGGVLGERTDVYCAGSMFYELLCGTLPFPDEDNMWAILARKIREPPEPLPLRDADVPTALAEVAMRAVARHPGDRFPSARAFGAAIAAAAELVWGRGWVGFPDASMGAPAPDAVAGQPDGGSEDPSTGLRRVFPAVSRHVDGRFAVAIHDVYRGWRAGKGPGGDASATTWEHLSEALKASNQAFADDIFAKLHGLGCAVHPIFGRDVAVLEFTADEVEDLAKKEHRRWVEERRGSGWTPGPERDVARKTSPYLVGWQDLPEDIKDYDRVLVRKIPQILASAHLEIQRPQ
jgi:predicted Ser/Thr protein kinase